MGGGFHGIPIDEEGGKKSTMEYFRKIFIELVDSANSLNGNSTSIFLAFLIVK